MSIFVMHLATCTSQTRAVNLCEHACMYVCVSLIITENMHCPLQHLSQTPYVAFVAFTCISFSAQQTNTQTVSDVEQWTRQAFRPFMLTVEGIECGRLQEGHASFNRQRGKTHTPFYFYLSYFHTYNVLPSS